MAGKLTSTLVFLTIATNIGSFLYGYDIGIISGSLVFIRREFNLSNFWQGLCVSSTLFTAWTSSTLGGTLANKFGRKKAVLISAALYTIASILMATSVNKFMFLASRCLLGVAVGLSSAVVPMYVSESSPTSLRGSLVMMSFLFIVLGQLVSSIMAASINSLLGSTAWRYMLAAGVIPSLIHLLTCFFIPESPRYLMMSSQTHLARKSLQDLRQSSNVEDEYNSIEIATKESSDQSSSFRSIFKQVISCPRLRRALIVGILLQVVKQVTGGTPLFYYTASIIEMSGISDTGDALWSAAIVNLIFVLTTLIGSYLVEKFGRRPLMLTSLLGCVISLIIISSGFYLTSTNSQSVTGKLFSGEDSNVTLNSTSSPYLTCGNYNTCNECTSNIQCGFCYLESTSSLQVTSFCLPGVIEKSSLGPCVNGSMSFYDDVDGESDKKSVTKWSPNHCPSNYSQVILAGLSLFLLFYGPGVGPLPFTINSEIYPVWCRSVCFAITVGFSWFFNVLMTFSFLPISEAITQSGLFFMYAIMTLSGLIALFFILPETRGMSLEEFEKIFSPKNNSKPKFYADNKS